MSFLYKALLKEQGNKPSDKPEPQSNEGHTSSDHNEWHTTAPQWSQGTSQSTAIYASSAEAKQWHWTAWLLIAILLLIVGGLSGYILGYDKAPAPGLWGGTNQSVQTPPSIQTPQSTQNSTTESNNANTDLALNESGSNNALNEAEVSLVEQETTTGEEDVNYSFKSGTLVADTAVAKTSATSDLESHNTADANAELKTVTVDDYAPNTVELDDVPDELKAAFDLAVAELEASQNGDSLQERDYPDRIIVETDSTLTDINDLTNQEQAVLPRIFYQMHIYASDNDNRWIKVNDKTLKEGEYLTNRLKLVEIRQDVVIWETAYRRFSQVALEDYK